MILASDLEYECRVAPFIRSPLVDMLKESDISRIHIICTNDFLLLGIGTGGEVYSAVCSGIGINCRIAVWSFLLYKAVIAGCKSQKLELAVLVRFKPMTLSIICGRSRAERILVHFCTAAL